MLFTFSGALAKLKRLSLRPNFAAFGSTLALPGLASHRLPATIASWSRGAPNQECAAEFIATSGLTIVSKLGGLVSPANASFQALFLTSFLLFSFFS